MNTDVREEIRARIDIADVVGRHVKLRQTGRNFSGLCPFHNEKTPSFTVSPERGTYHCFGCGAGGDVFRFIMEIEGLSFPEALKRLADECGVKIEENRSFEKNSSLVPRDRLAAMNKDAAEYFYASLKNSDSAKQYFKDRGLTGSTVKEFSIGYSPAGWDSLLNHMQTLGYSPAELAECGLVIESKNSGSAGWYDRFRDRVMFPICDVAGRFIAFAGRSLEKDAKPKYLNSPETVLYRKNRVLYGLGAARNGIKADDRVIVVEGYMDWLAMWQVGVRNAVASCGTALTEEHGRLISRFTQRVLLLFDGDSAGIAAAEKAIATLAPQQLDLSVCVLPGDEDPDSFIGKFGAEAFRLELDKRAKPALTFLLERALTETPDTGAAAKAAAFKAVEPFLKTVTDNILRSAFVKETAEALDIPEHLVYERLGIARPASPQGGRNRVDAKNDPEPRGGGSPVIDAGRVTRYIGTEEGSFIHLLARYPALIKKASEKTSPEELTVKFSAKLFSLFVSYSETHPDLSGIIEEAEDDTAKMVLSRMLVTEIPLDDPDQELAHKLERMEVLRLERRKKALAGQLAAETEPSRVTNILKEQREIAKEIVRKKRQDDEKRFN